MERTGKADNYKDSINHHHHHHDRITGLSRLLSVQAGRGGVEEGGGGQDGMGRGEREGGTSSSPNILKSSPSVCLKKSKQMTVTN